MDVKCVPEWFLYNARVISWWRQIRRDAKRRFAFLCACRSESAELKLFRVQAEISLSPLKQSAYQSRVSLSTVQIIRYLHQIQIFPLLLSLLRQEINSVVSSKSTVCESLSCALKSPSDSVLEAAKINPVSRPRRMTNVAAPVCARKISKWTDMPRKAQYLRGSILKLQNLWLISLNEHD